MKILHIEDRRENRLLIRKLLESKGFTVVDAADGLTGLALARAVEPALILIDINIPGLNGYEVITRLKAEPALTAIPMVAITAEGDRGRALALGFDGFITKPISIARFTADIQRFLSGYREEGRAEERAGHLLEHSQEVVDRLEGQLRALTHAHDRLKEVDRLKMAVLRNVSHELATPMTPLLGYTRMLAQEEMGPINDKQAQTLGRMEGALSRLKHLIDNLLEVTRFATGAISLKPEVVQPDALLRAVVGGLSEAIAARGARLTLRATAVEEALVDPQRLSEAFEQLIDNALKFGPEGGALLIEGQILVEGEGDRRLLEWAISDEGPGIPAAQRDAVIEPFYQIDGSATRAFGGAGLGLAVAHQVAALHGGALSITSSTLGGARVALRVPTRPV
ncbi:hybrid sensor histidine kinase/response regulator [Myxococcota bacterium]|nr:hybrid sensor histidine kinase/response regulator [Myxococcota bacterium]MBU1432324.1 hybrid sensor histidine kinase/response regulator [Myxococcota bacterium]MBU1897044.1 hybrid sensor histidine kinase/response regulator [Myxococcota bacterium]